MESCKEFVMRIVRSQSHENCKESSGELQESSGEL